MANGSFKIKKSANLDPQSGSVVTSKGDLAYNEATDKLELYNGAADPLVNEAKAATLTNKSVDADNNTITNIANAAIKSGAAIARDKLANGTADHVVINSGAGAFSSEATLAKSRGGTGQDNSSLTFPASGTVQATTPNNHGILVSGAGATATVIAPNASTAFPLVSGGASADPSWAKLTEAGGGTNQSTYTTGDILYASASNTLSKLAVGSANQVIQSVGGVPTWKTVNLSGINYISGNPSAEVDTSGWATYADAAGALPVNGTGGVANVTWTRSTSSPLRGSAEFLFTKDAANRQGEGVSYDFTIDSADQGKVLNINFDYAVRSGTYASSDLTVYIYDVTNSLVIQPGGYTVQSAVAALPMKQIATFQTAINSTSYRLILHVASTSASAYTVGFDNFVVGPQSIVNGTPVTDWVLTSGFTPSVGFGTTTLSSIWTKRNGDSTEVRGYFKAGTLAASEARLDLPSGFLIDLTKMTSTTAVQRVGTWQRIRNGATVQISSQDGEGPIYFNGANSGGVYFSTATASDVLTNSNVNAFLSNNDGISFIFDYPTAGKSSNVQMSSDTDTRVVLAKAGGDAASASGGDPIIFPTTVYDTHGAYNASTGRFTVPVSGYYRIYGYVNSADAGFRLHVYKNAVQETYAAGSTDSNGEGTFTYVVQANAGDLLDLRPLVAFDITATSHINFERVSGPAQVAASESVNARYYASATALSGSLATIVWTTKDYDSHNSMSSGVYTCPISGKYSVQSALALSGTFALNNTTVIEIQKNGVAISNLTRYIAAAITNDGIDIEDTVSCVAGDQIRIQVSNSGTSPAIVASNTRNYIAISRVGN
jgi:hypothetical protein